MLPSGDVGTQFSDVKFGNITFSHFFSNIFNFIHFCHLVLLYLLNLSSDLYFSITFIKLFDFSHFSRQHIWLLGLKFARPTKLNTITFAFT